MTLRKRGFTLVEILTTITILAIVAGLAVPTYTAAIEQARTNEARTNLNVIHMGEKLYFLARGVYWGPGGTTIANANAPGALNTDMSATYYDTIAVTAQANGYTARLTRNAVQGGDGVSWFQYVYDTTVSQAPVLTNG